MVLMDELQVCAPQPPLPIWLTGYQSPGTDKHMSQMVISGGIQNTGQTDVVHSWWYISAECRAANVYLSRDKITFHLPFPEMDALRRRPWIHRLTTYDIGPPADIAVGPTQIRTLSHVPFRNPYTWV